MEKRGGSTDLAIMKRKTGNRRHRKVRERGRTEGGKKQPKFKVRQYLPLRTEPATFLGMVGTEFFFFFFDARVNSLIDCDLVKSRCDLQFTALVLRFLSETQLQISYLT